MSESELRTQLRRVQRKRSRLRKENKFQGDYIAALEKLKNHADHSEFCEFRSGPIVDTCECGFADDAAQVRFLKSRQA